MTARLRSLIDSINSARPSVAQSCEHLAAVQGLVVGLAALDLVLRRLRARVMRVALVDYILGMNLTTVPLTRPASEFQLTRSPTSNRFVITSVAARGCGTFLCSVILRAPSGQTQFRCRLRDWILTVTRS